MAVAFATASLSCPICGSPQRSLFMHAPDLNYHRPDPEYLLYRCASCTHLYLDPVPEDLSAHYPSQNYAYNTLPSAELPPVKARIAALLDRAGPLRRKLASVCIDLGYPLLPPFPGARLLDVGCGSGHYLVPLQRRGWEIYGVEPSPIGVANARAALGQDRIMQGDAQVLAGLPRASFDVVTMFHAIEHLVDPMLALRQARDLLKPGGRLVIATPNGVSWESRAVGRTWVFWSLPRHVAIFTPRSIERALLDSGLRPIQIGSNYLHGRIGPSVQRARELGARVRNTGGTRLLMDIDGLPCVPRLLKILLRAVTVAPTGGPGELVGLGNELRVTAAPV